MDNCLNSDHRIGVRAMMAAKEVNRLRGWKRTEDRFEENKARIKKNCLAVLSGMSAFSWEKYTAALEAKGYKVKLKMDASVTVRGYSIQSENSVYKSSVIGRELTPSRIQETWEKMRPENRYGQMTPAERVAFALSEEGKNYLFPGVSLWMGNAMRRWFPEELHGSSLKRAERTSSLIRGRSVAVSFGPPFFSSPVTSMPPPPSHKTAEAADPPQTRTGAATKTRMTPSGPAAASARRVRWLLHQ